MCTELSNALKERVQDLVDNNLGEVTNQSKHKIGGIYMLYVDDFSDKKIIPFYIGKSSNFQKRHKQHMKYIISLNRFSSAYYNALLKNCYYNGTGHFLYCKIFAYMMRHKCQLRQLRMVILEQIENADVRDATEEKYIAELAAPYIGFNQILSLTYRNTLRSEVRDEQVKHYYSLLELDAKMCDTFAGFGYSDFNVKYALPRNVSFRERENIDTSQAQTALNSLFEQQLAYAEYKEQSVFLLQLSEEAQDKYIATLFKKPDCRKLISNVAREIFLANECSSEKVLGHFVDRICNEGKHSEKQITNWANIAAKKQFEPFQLFAQKYADLVSQYETEKIAQQKMAEQLESDAKRAQDTLEQHLGLLSYDCFGVHDEYDNFPLGDLGPNYTVVVKKLGTSSDKDRCVINFIMSCAWQNRYLTPRIVAIQYIMLIGEDVQADTLFLTNHSKYFYVEKGIENPTAISLFEPTDTPITPVASANPENSMQLVEFGSLKRLLYSEIYSDIAPLDYITVSSEYKTGINDYTVHNHPTVSLEQALSSIESSLPLNAKITIITTESRGQLARAVENEMFSSNNSRIYNALLQFLN